MKKLVLILAIASLTACSTNHFATNYKIQTEKRNYYTNAYEVKGNEIVFSEFCRNGSSRGTFVLNYADVKIVPSSTLPK